MPGYEVSGAWLIKIEKTILGWELSGSRAVLVACLCHTERDGIPLWLGLRGTSALWTSYCSAHLLTFVAVWRIGSWNLATSWQVCVNVHPLVLRSDSQRVPLSRGDAVRGKVWKCHPYINEQRGKAVNLSSYCFNEISDSYQQSDVVSSFCCPHKQNSF